MTDVTQPGWVFPLSDKGKRGAPLGNQNARKHGLYAKKLSKREQAVYEAAADMEGLDQEIALVRTKIESIIKSGPASMPALMLAVSMLVKLLKAKAMLRRDNPAIAGDFEGKMLREIAAPMGFWPAYNEEGDIVYIEIQGAPPRKGGLVALGGRPEDKLNAQNMANRSGSQAQDDEIG
jgi:hypothetical protein